MAQGKKVVLTDEQKRTIEQLAALFLTRKEIIANMKLDMNPQTFSLHFNDIYEKGRDYGCSILRAKQVEVAKNGNVTMLIWLGKQYLGQREPNNEIDLKETDLKTIADAILKASNG